MPDTDNTQPELKNPAASKEPVESNSEDRLRQINEEVYKHNLELAIVNKTLSLLRKLYQISLLELDPITLANDVSDAVRKDLNLEIAGIFVFNEKADSLEPLHFSKSDRLFAALDQVGFHFKDATITAASKQPFFEKLIQYKASALTNNIADVWSGFIPTEKLDIIREAANIKTILAFPLITQNKIIGVLLFGFNRDYNSLSEHEKEAIKSVTDVVAVALDKAYLYKALQDANEKLKSLDKLKTEFLSLASHQLRSPITAIKGYTSMLLENSYGAITETQHEPISRIFQSSLNLANVVEDLLDVAKIEQGGMQYAFQDVDLELITSALYNEFSLTAKSKGLELSYDHDSAKPCMVNADPVKFRQVVLNLLDNSIKYTEKGFVKLSIKKEGSEAVISITDSGIGMSPQTKEKLFGKFNRGEGEKMNAGGSGLGLYLVKQIVEAHKAKISADSPGVGQGATFTVKMALK